ncbi:MAG: S-layer protein [Nanoarchaeota archaeon]
MKWTIHLITLVLLINLVTALDLSDYPYPFVDNGRWSGLIVVGKEAATLDIAGAIDIAATISTITNVEYNVEVDEKLVSDTQEFVDPLSSKLASAISSHLEALKGGQIKNPFGIFSYTQSIILPSATVNYAIDPDDDTDTPDFYLIIPEHSAAYVYRISFSPALEVEHQESFLEGIKDKTTILFGKNYTFTSAEHSAQNNIKFTLLGGEIKETFGEGEKGSFLLDKELYEVELMFIDQNHAKFIINGQPTSKLSKGDTYKINGQVSLALSEIFYQNYAGGIHQATFYLGSQKIVLTDTDTTAHNYGGTVAIDGNELSQVVLNIKTTKDDGTVDGSGIKISALEVNYTPSDDLYIPLGGRLSPIAKIIEEESGNLFLNGFDFDFRNLVNDDVTEEIALKSGDKKKYRLEFTNLNKQKYSLDILSCTTSVCSNISLGKLSGSTFYDLVVNESEAIDVNDYFVLSKEKYSHIMRLTKIDTTNSRVTLKDEAIGGKTYYVDYDTTNLADFGLDGFIYKINISSSSIYADVNGDSAFNGAGAQDLYTYYKAYLTLSPAENGFNITTEYHDGNERDSISVGVGWDSINSELDINDSLSLGYLYGFDAGTLQIGDDKIEEGYTRYGLYAKWDDNISQGTFSWVYPQRQIFAETYVVGANKKGERITTETISLLGKNISLFDSEVADKTSSNFILVGGPCVNKLAAELMGNPSPCDRNFTAGQAVIKLYENVFGGTNSALVIAGHSAEDTKNAALVLRDYSNYVLKGQEVLVVSEDGKTKVITS